MKEGVLEMRELDSEGFCGLGDQEISESEGEFKDVIAHPVIPHGGIGLSDLNRVKSRQSQTNPLGRCHAHG
jgi:hypothetical protein